MWDLPSDSNLTQPDPSDFQFVPDIGFRYIGAGGSVFLQTCAISKPNEFLTDQELFNMAKAIENYLAALKGVPQSDHTFHKIFRDDDFQLIQDRFVYKFVSEETYERYIRKGSFLLSSLERFRRFEEQGSPAGDRFEGWSYCAYTVGNRELTVATLSGFDTFAFSATRDLDNAEEMATKFGSVILRIELFPFARCLGRQVTPVSRDIRLVRYADLKMHRGSLPLKAITGFPPHLTAGLARALRNRGRLPSLFAKPNRFASEREVRIAFRMDKDVPDSLVVTHPRLCDYITRID